MWMTGTADTDGNGDIDDDDRISWQDAVDFCNDLVYAGFDDWYLPDFFMLSAIVNYGVYNPAIDTTVFDCKSKLYWSSTSYAIDANSVWAVLFNDGYDSWSGKTSRDYVRCVRGGDETITIGSYVDNEDGTVRDQGTDLTWMQSTADINNDGNINYSDDSVAWKDALAYCEDLDFAGYTDWRLPNQRALKSIVKYDAFDPAIDPVFECESAYYWSSTTYANAANRACGVDFYHGYAGCDDKTNYSYRYVRCVRGGLRGNGPFDLSVIPTGTGGGTVTSNPAGIDCPGDCTESYSSGQAVQLTATADPGSVFSGWSGDCAGTASTVTVTMDKAKSCTATFNAGVSSYTLTAAVDPAGGGTVTSNPAGIDCPGDCTEDYNDGTAVALTANPAADYAFDHWTGDCAGSNPVCDLTMNSDRNATAHFVCAAIGAPAANDPGNTISSGTAYQVSWGAVDGAQDYVIQEATDAAFTTIVSTHTVATTQQQYTHDVAVDTTYYYRVRARRSCGSESPWSNVVDMTVLTHVFSHFDLTGQWDWFYKWNNFFIVFGVFEVQNVGDQEYHGLVTVDFYSSDDRQLDGNDPFLERRTVDLQGQNTVLIFSYRSGESWFRSSPVPNVIAVIDPDNLIDESNEGNNVILNP